MSKRLIKVYVKDSNIKGIGKGLFAKTEINKGSIIVEYKGKLKKQSDKMTNARSNIYFNDGCILECSINDLASYANDAINFTEERRKLMKSLKSEEPFYKKHENAKINAEIKINDNLHRAFLIANQDIKKDEEIYCHYGFMYWFKKEMIRGVLVEEEIKQNGFPNDIYKYPGFINYMKEFYPKYKSHKIKKSEQDDNYDLVIHLSDGNYILMPMKNFEHDVVKIESDKLVNLIQEGGFDEELKELITEEKIDIEQETLKEGNFDDKILDKLLKAYTKKL